MTQLAFLSLRNKKGEVVLVPVHHITEEIYQMKMESGWLATYIALGDGSLFVQETPAQIANQLRDAGYKVARSPLGPPEEQRL